MTDQSPVRVRFAPSPTGPLHMGGVRTALYNYLFARKSGGKFLLRIEDTDQSRFVAGAEDYIIEALKWCGINPDEGVGFGGDQGPYRQSERKEMYRQYADQLVASEHAYYAFDTEEELNDMREKAKQAGMPNWQYNAISRNNLKNSLTLPEDEVQRRLQSGEPYVIRIKIPRNEEVRLHDLIRGFVVVQTMQMDDKVLFKSDGMPTYHLANVVDDYLMEITHVIRGEEWLPSAPLHVLLYRYLGWEDKMPQFAHLPLLLRPDGNGKLSKRDGDRLGFPVFPLNWKDPHTGELSNGYRERGYFADAFVNMLALLGWNPGTTQEVFSMNELIESFSLERVSKSGARFDFDKTNWFNQQYLRAKDDKELAQLLRREFPEQLSKVENSFLEAVCGLMKERAVFVKDIWNEGSYFFENPTGYDEQAVSKRWKTGSAELMEGLADALNNTEPFTPAKVEETFQRFLKERELTVGALLPLFRITVTGRMTGPGMFDVSALIGREATVERIKTGIGTLDKFIKAGS